MPSKVHIFELPFDVITPTDIGRPESQLFSDLYKAAAQDSKRGKARRREFPLWTNPSLSIAGWRFNEWDYDNEKITLPSNARGLFSFIEPGSPQHESIVIRGYNKFFNLNELSFLNWDWIKSSTKGPYEVTSKENGCIIFISGLADGTLIVTSKQSTGPREDSPDERNHSFVGQKWVRKHLASKNIKETDFAKLLHQLNVTAIGELCDDTFEEHVLAYPPDHAGIYLHGLNLNIDKFTTYPFSAVESFAKQFGFIPTPYLTINTADELQTFLETCAETGCWNNKEVEGFVIRTKAQLDELHPEIYSDYFFKYKFEEPYLMYRQWREVTRAYLGGKARFEIRINKHIYYTKKYLDFVIPLLSNDEALRDSYLNNHNIIKVRQMFLDNIGMTGSAMVHEDEEMNQNICQTLKPKYILVPVSTIGCGKTTVAVALRKLFPTWGHVQNDDIVKRPKPTHFAKMCMEAVRYSSNVVIADRNNHQRRERAQIFTDMNNFKNMGTRNVFVCLNFRGNYSQGSENKDLWDLTSKRVFNRGDNHQSISAASDDKNKVMMIMKGFINRFEPVEPFTEPDSNFDLVIDLETSGTDSSRINLEKIVKTLHEKYPDIVPELPTAAQLDDAFNYSLTYIPDKVGIFDQNRANVDQKKMEKKKKKPRYFAINIVPPNTSSTLTTPPKSLETAMGQLSLEKAPANSPETTVEQNMIHLINRLFEVNPDADQTVWKLLQKNNRVQTEFHVTLVHKTQGGPGSTDESAKKYFEALKTVLDTVLEEKKDKETSASKNPTTDANGFTVVTKKTIAPPFIELGSLTADVALKNLYWTPNLMGIEVNIISKNAEKDDTPHIYTLNTHAHITIGTSSTSVAAVEAGKALNNPDDSLVKLPWNIEPRELTNQAVVAYF
ncbi:uncharacterized protein SAPINGB_P000295 [Magnusiomyces paraingens]|uniref:tRNA ligase n=1 Tax=Magnusiomyces paraingens TaxID=2606893 RepID=A0A5E8AYP4_9ASCO|nr:uncharacterized protein SAPINGB_P000295 [Saprochaete ingens]VVT44086.1 unnamed protein product [Saprochaete ingens]